MYVSSVPQPRHSYGSVAAYPAGLNYGASGYYGGAPLVGGQALVQSTNLIQGGVAPQYVAAGGIARQGGALVRNSYERLPAHANVIDAGVNLVPQKRLERSTDFQTVKRVEYTPKKTVEYVPVEKVEYEPQYREEVVPIERVQEHVQYIPQQRQIAVAPRLVQSGYAVQNNPALVATTVIRQERVQEVPCPCEIFDETYSRKDYLYRDKLVYGTERGSKLRGGLTPWDKYDRALHKMRKEVGYERRNPDNYLHLLGDSSYY